MRTLVFFVVVLLCLMFFVGVARGNHITPNSDYESTSVITFERIKHDALELMTPFNFFLLLSIPILTIFGISADSYWFSSQQKQLTAGEAYATMKANLRPYETLHRLPGGTLVVTSAQRPTGRETTAKNAARLMLNSKHMLEKRGERVRDYYEYNA